MYLVDWTTHFVDFIDLEQHLLMGFLDLYITIAFFIPLKLQNLSFALDLRFNNS